MKTGKASSTARLIARSTVLLAMEGKYSALVNPTTAKLSKIFADEYSGNRDPLIILMQSRLIRKILLFLERFVLRGIFLHYALRKKHIRLIAEKCIREGFSQVVVLGAGFDTLAFSLRDSNIPLKIFEFDYPATQAVKLSAMRKAGWNEDRIEFVATDLTTSDKKNFLNTASKNLSASEPTVIIAEGLLMYLNEVEVGNLLRCLSEFFDHHIRIIFTFLETDTNGKPNFYKESSVVDSYLRWKGERFRWGVPHSRLPDFLCDNGFGCVEMFQPEDREDAHNEDSLLPKAKNQIGEMICVAERETNVG